MDRLPLSSPKYRVIAVRRKSTAAYAKGVKVGDVLEFKLDLVPSTGGANGNYAFPIRVFVNGEFLGSSTQNTILAAFHSDYNPVFELEELTEI